MSHKIVRSGSLLSRLGIYLLRKGGVYKKDLIAYACHITPNQSNASALIKELTNRSILETKELGIKNLRRIKATDKHPGYSYGVKGRMVEICLLSEHGLAAMYHNYCLLAEKPLPISYFRKLREPYTADISSLSLTAGKALVNALNASHIKTFFNLCGVQSEESSKPSLEQIYAFRNGLPYTPEPMSRYRFYEDRETYELDMQKGFYYTAQEMRRFFGRHRDGAERFSTIARGLYISDRFTLVVYSNGIGNYNMLYCPSLTGEFRVIRMLKVTGLSCNEIERDEEGNVVKDGFGNAKIVARHVELMALPEAESFIYSTAEGRRYGRNPGGRGNGFEKLLITPRSLLFSEEENGYDADTYDSFYAFPWSAKGVESFKRLMCCSDMSYRNIYDRILLDERFMSNAAGWPYPLLYNANGKWRPCAYLPVYELLFLEGLKYTNKDAVLIAGKEMREVIQHITHKSHDFLDADTLEISDSGEVLRYDGSGYPAGKKKIQDYLLAKHLKAEDKQYSLLPLKFGMESVRFYNAVAEGEIALEECEAELVTTEYYPMPFRKRKVTRTSLYADIYEEIKKIAEEEEQTIFRTVDKIIALGLKERKRIKEEKDGHTE